MSQCTFWRSVLSDPFLRKTTRIRSRCCLNAPFGARCFLVNEFDIDFKQQKYLS